MQKIRTWDSKKPVWRPQLAETSPVPQCQTYHTQSFLSHCRLSSASGTSGIFVSGRPIPVFHVVQQRLRKNTRTSGLTTSFHVVPHNKILGQNLCDDSPKPGEFSGSSKEVEAQFRNQHNSKLHKRKTSSGDHLLREETFTSSCSMGSAAGLRCVTGSDVQRWNVMSDVGPAPGYVQTSSRHPPVT